MHHCIKACIAGLVASSHAACLTSGTEATINNALKAGGTNAVVQLCPSSTFIVNDTVQFTANGQELSTQGYPTDGTRATIIADPTNRSNLTTLIRGSGGSFIKVRNLVVDGNRGALGPATGDGTILLGGNSNGVVVSYVASKNARGFSCLHVIEGACRNATLAFNDIGPCGTQTAFADGISMACTSSLVTSNTITGPTDGGIVIFGAPGSTITNNTIISSDTERGFGAINLVDYLPYNGNYSNVQVTNNKIVGRKMFDIGIAVGGHVWSSQSNPLFGPTNINGNSVSGNVSFPVALNGWYGGLNITNTDVSGVTTDPHVFADAFIGNGNDCSNNAQVVWSIFNAATKLSYWAPGIYNGTLNLDSGFVNSSTGQPGNYLCAQPALNTSVTFLPGMLSVDAANNSQVTTLHRGFYMHLQGDNNLIALNVTGPNMAYPVLWASGKTVSSCAGGCSLTFQSDGNLVNYVNGTQKWASNTGGGSGASNRMIVRNTAPWIQVINSTGSILWDTSKLT